MGGGTGKSTTLASQESTQIVTSQWGMQQEQSFEMGVP